MAPSHSLFLLSIVLIPFSSCKKHTKASPAADQPAAYADYTVLKPGNYWVYQTFQINEDGTEQSFPVFDSSYVEKDTTIDNLTYHKWIGNGDTHLVRDSLSYLVEIFTDRSRKVRFSSEDFTDTLDVEYLHEAGNPADTTGKVVSKMCDKDMPFTTPAGTFNTDNAQQVLRLYHVYQNNHNDVVRYINTRYARGVGKVSETRLYNLDSPVVYQEKRLLRYHLQ